MALGRRSTRAGAVEHCGGTWNSVVGLQNYTTKNLLTSCRELSPEQQEWGGRSGGLARRGLEVPGGLLQVWKEQKQRAL